MGGSDQLAGRPASGRRAVRVASITKRPDGKWRARHRGPDGRERARHFARKTDAERWLATQGADVARGEWVDPALGRMTFGDWAQRWEAGLSDLRPTTKALNLGVLANHLLPRFGGWSLAQITTSDVKAMVADDLARGYSNSAVRRHVIVLRTILDAAVVEGRIKRNPCQGVKLPPESSRPMRFLEPGEVAQLGDAIRPAHYRTLIFTAAYVGLRWGELAGLRVERVDPLRRTIQVVEQLVEVGGKVEFGPPKTKAGRRTVTMPATVAEMLGEHMASPAVRASGLVFPTVSGQLMRRANFRKVWLRAVTNAGFSGGPLGGLVFHELRHTAAALAIAQGAHPLAIRDRLGHSSITVTMDTYGGLFPSLDEAIAEGLDGVLRQSLADESRTKGGQVASLRRSGP
jgi:integrase